MINKEKLLEKLEGNDSLSKSASLKKLLKLEANNPELVPVQKELVPLHFTSNKYYSLYSPTMCAYYAHKSGCFAVAINDYATVKAYKELKKSCEILSLPYACGYHVECKPLFNEKKGALYGYGLAYKDYKNLDNELAFVREAKKQGIIKAIQNINKSISGYGITIPTKLFIKNKKNSITEKSVAKVFAEILIKKFGKDEALLEFLKTALKIDSCENDLRFLKEQENLYFVEDLAKVLYNKYNLLKAKDKKEDAKKFIKINEKYGAISAYRVEIKNFDENYLKNVADTLLDNGFNAVTFKCNDIDCNELDKIVNYFLERGIIAISLYRMGLPRQHMPTFEASNQLFLNSLAVIGNAISVNCDIKDGLFGKNMISDCENLKKRIEIFSNIVKGKR